ncbi:MAG: hypothetical protein ACRELF_28085, partial [Gemmataceae bacterium]
LVHIGGFVYQLIWVMPAMQALYAKFSAAMGISSLMSISSGFGMVISLLIISYPISVLIVLLLPSTSAAFRGELPAREDETHEMGEFGDDPWREPRRSDKF